MGKPKPEPYYYVDPINLLRALTEVEYCAGQKTPLKKAGIEKEIYAVAPSKEFLPCPLKWWLETDGIWTRKGCKLLLTTEQNCWKEAEPPFRSHDLVSRFLAKKGYRFQRTNEKMGSLFSGVKVKEIYTSYVLAFRSL